MFKIIKNKEVLWQSRVLSAPRVYLSDLNLVLMPTGGLRSREVTLTTPTSPLPEEGVSDSEVPPLRVGVEESPRVSQLSLRETRNETGSGTTDETKVLRTPINTPEFEMHKFSFVFVLFFASSLGTTSLNSSFSIIVRLMIKWKLNTISPIGFSN